VAASLCAQDPPQGKGKDTFAKVCSQCHALEQVTAKRHSKAGWDHIIDDMAGKGAEATDEQFDAIIDYLTEHFGPVNVNQATVKELTDSQVFSTQESAAIVQYREGHGKFADVEALKKVPGLMAIKVEKIKDAVIF
jgi:competence protein ComEA